MSMQSSVGNKQLYESNEQKPDKSQPERFEEGKANSHKPLDSKDERSTANKLANEVRLIISQKKEEEDDFETSLSKKDPTLPAKAHGNEPSKGAKIDAELQAEEEAELKKKGRV
ncbi:MAG: hypothetical protein M1838_004274 [Thelocarpon superellum]|nr:MAG: hypothetical protein M1838_004274 [Thelocarpon superellum]